MEEYLASVRVRIGQNLRELRIRRGLSQEGLAERAGNTNRHVGQVERAEVNVTIDILARLAHHLSVDVSELLAIRPIEAAVPPPVPAAGGFPTSSADPPTSVSSAVASFDGAVETTYSISAADLDQIEQALRAVARVRGSGPR